MKQNLIHLSSPVTELSQIGPAKASKLEKLNIHFARDFLFTFPRDHENFSEVTPVTKLEVGRKMTVRGKVTKVQDNWGFQGRRRLLRIFVEITDDTGTIQVTWYNLRFLKQQLPIGRELFIAGVVEKNKIGKWAMRSPAFEFADRGGQRLHTAGMTPIYSETSGVTSHFIRYQVRRLLPLVKTIPEYIPSDILKRNKLIGIQEALSIIHFPKNEKEKAQAERRLRFDELFFLQLAALVRRRDQEHKQAVPISFPKNMSTLTKLLPYTLTDAQAKAMDEIRQDIGKPHPMNRLLQGDVGSGKSAVALLTTKTVLDAGYKVIYLAPTEILARQQYESFSETLGSDRVHLLVGALKAGQKRAVKEFLSNTEPGCVVGTHAVLQDDVIREHVALIIIDEQHRFGVRQRAALQQKDGVVPHLLSMTATPIPRTLNLTVFGDLDVSVLNELPAGRKPITTRIIAPDARDDAITHLLEELHQGRQAYVISPLVEESETLQQKSAKKAYEEMKAWLPGIAVGIVHGKMAAEEKEAVMRNFSAGAIQVLVSTSVVEVGVNVPNATIMIIEGAERFGLAQLHQFRGRIGRGEHASTCYLFPTTQEAATSKRLQVIEQTSDGFVIAEEDLELRGPGEVYGVVQSGFGNMKVASLLDYPTIKMARQEAENILADDPKLTSHVILKKKVEQKNTVTHFE